MTTRHAQPQQAGSRLATIGIVVALAALVFSFFSEEPAPTTTSEEPDVDADVDRPHVPAPRAPRTKAHTGHSGHPCLLGERDGDGDGYCGE